MTMQPDKPDIEEARELSEQFEHLVYGPALARLIAHVRQQAERAALEKAAKVCERYAGDSRQIIKAVRALMQPEQKGKG